MKKKAERQAGGFTLIELMIALVLGLVVTGAAISAFLSSKQVYATTESLGRIQENARVAFELLARDIREAGGNACSSSLQPVNVLNNPTANSYTNFAGGVVGYGSGNPGIPFGSAARERVDATSIGQGNESEAIVLKSAMDGGMRIIANNASNVNIRTTEPVPADWLGAIVMACDPEHAAIFQVTAVDSSPNPGVKIQTGSNIFPGNADNCLAPGLNCPNGNPKRYAFGCTQGWWQGGVTYPNRPPSCVYEGAPPAVLARLTSISWYLGQGTKSGHSLYRRLDGPTAVADEIAEHVRSLAFEYLLDGQYVSAGSVPDDDAWARVTAVRIRLTFEGEDHSAGMGGQLLAREMAATVALRNRLQ